MNIMEVVKRSGESQKISFDKILNRIEQLSQIEPILEAFLPTENEIEEAKEILIAFANASKGAVAFKGKMIDLPIVKSMETRLRLAGIDPDEFM